MDPAFAPGTTPKAAVFHDGLGERRRISDVSGADTIEQLCLRSDLTAIPSFEFALRERASRLANFRHVYYARVRSVDRLTRPILALRRVSGEMRSRHRQLVMLSHEYNGLQPVSRINGNS